MHSLLAWTGRELTTSLDLLPDWSVVVALTEAPPSSSSSSSLEVSARILAHMAASLSAAVKAGETGLGVLIGLGGVASASGSLSVVGRARLFLGSSQLAVRLKKESQL